MMSGLERIVFLHAQVPQELTFHKGSTTAALLGSNAVVSKH